MLVQFVQICPIPYTQNNWRVKYLANQSKIVVGVTLIWRKAVAVSKCNSYRPETALFKFGGLKIIRQTAKLNTPPIILRIRYFGPATIYANVIHMENYSLLKM